MNVMLRAPLFHLNENLKRTLVPHTFLVINPHVGTKSYFHHFYTLHQLACETNFPFYFISFIFFFKEKEDEEVLVEVNRFFHCVCGKMRK
jgi:hypothetical protein